MSDKQGSNEKQEEFNLHQLSTLILVILFFWNFSDVTSAFSQLIFDQSYNSFGDADITFVLQDTTYTWTDIKESTFKIDETPCNTECINHYASAEDKVGTRYFKFDVTNYKQITVNYQDPDKSTMILMGGITNDSEN